MLVERSNFTVSRMGQLLGVCRSGFYACLGRVPSQGAIRAEGGFGATAALPLSEPAPQSEKGVGGQWLRRQGAQVT
jgi:hypothetical protein